jgi:hypothetical protein
MNSFDEAIKKQLDRDGIAEAEKVTGKRWSNDPSQLTSFIGLRKHMEINQRREDLLMIAGDSIFSDKLPRYQGVISAEGFECVLIEPFTGSNGEEEHFFIYWHPDGILLVFDTHQSIHINGGNFYYNIDFKEPRARSLPISSGGFEHAEDGRLIWTGSHDCREAIKFRIRELREHGTFLNPWVHRPFLWLLHYMDTKVPGYDYKAINEARIAKLPEHVRKALGPA